MFCLDWNESSYMPMPLHDVGSVLTCLPLMYFAISGTAPDTCPPHGVHCHQLMSADMTRLTSDHRHTVSKCTNLYLLWHPASP